MLQQTTYGNKKPDTEPSEWGEALQSQEVIGLSAYVKFRLGGPQGRGSVAGGLSGDQDGRGPARARLMDRIPAERHQRPGDRAVRLGREDPRGPSLHTAWQAIPGQAPHLPRHGLSKDTGSRSLGRRS